MTIVNTRKDFLIACECILRNGNYPYRPIAFEIGVYQGDFSQLILDFIRPVRLVLVDPFTEGEKYYADGTNTAYSTQEDFIKVVSRFKELITLNRIYIWKDYSYNIKMLITSNIDFIYHDASHLYEDLKRDLNEWLPKMKDGAMIAGHDYGNELFPGVKQAVDEFCNEQDFEMIIFNQDGGDYALMKK